MGRWELEKKVVEIDSVSPGKKPAADGPDAPVVHAWGCTHVVPVLPLWSPPNSGQC